MPLFGFQNRKMLSRSQNHPGNEPWGEVHQELIMLVMLGGSSSLHIKWLPVRLGTPHIRTIVQAREEILNYKQLGPLPPTSHSLLTG